MDLDKIYFMPGDVVTLKQDIPNKPTMVVIKKKTLMIKPSVDINLKNNFTKEKDKDKEFFQGMLCMWFTKEGVYQEKIFSTKDLIKL